MSNLRHKTPDELRSEIVYQEARINVRDGDILDAESRLQRAKLAVESEEKLLWELRQKRNNHHQRLVWARNYLMMKEG